MNREKIRENAREYSKTEHAKQAAARYQEKHKEEIKKTEKLIIFVSVGLN